ncbi:MAG TPA: hypothetical protein VFG04_16480 [Planctomycetaceae bacterium]|jgi:hypothetical protein|nr:hypothetical protein [Planctomycetaceae bacterium]
MNCDDVFDALTDPQWADAAELAEHLAKCPRCRELKQVLEPALSLLCGDLPAEPAMRAALPHEEQTSDDAVLSKRPFLSVEAIGVAEAAAARLASQSAPSRSSRVIRLPGHRVSGRAVQGVLCAAFGGLAVFCIALWDGKSEVTPQPLLVPTVKPAGVCTRNAVRQKTTQPRENARAVILSCVACHLQEHQPRVGPLRTSLFRFPRRGADRSLFAWNQTEVAKAHGPIPEVNCLPADRRLRYGNA